MTDIQAMQRLVEAIEKNLAWETNQKSLAKTAKEALPALRRLVKAREAIQTLESCEAGQAWEQWRAEFLSAPAVGSDRRVIKKIIKLAEYAFVSGYRAAQPPGAKEVKGDTRSDY